MQRDRYWQKVSLRRGRRPADLSGPDFLLYSLADGTHPRNRVSLRDDSLAAENLRIQAGIAG